MTIDDLAKVLHEAQIAKGATKASVALAVAEAVLTEAIEECEGLGYSAPRGRLLSLLSTLMGQK